MEDLPEAAEPAPAEEAALEATAKRKRASKLEMAQRNLAGLKEKIEKAQARVITAGNHKGAAAKRAAAMQKAKTHLDSLRGQLDAAEKAVEEAEERQRVEAEAAASLRAWAQTVPKLQTPDPPLPPTSYILHSGCGRAPGPPRSPSLQQPAGQLASARAALASLSAAPREP